MMTLDEMFEEVADNQRKEADIRDANPAIEALRIKKMQAQQDVIDREIADGIRSADGALIDEDLPDDEEE